MEVLFLEMQLFIQLFEHDNFITKKFELLKILLNCLICLTGRKMKKKV